MLIDTSNAFNSLNGKVARHNMAIQCHSLATGSAYGGHSKLFVDGETIYSREGTTEGESLAMVFDASPTIPLADACKVMRCKVCFVDDATGVGRLFLLQT